MTKTRGMGPLEAEVMEYLWMVGTGTPAEVRTGLGADLAYTTVMTILTRLWKKGFLERERTGRSFTYRPVESQAEHRARGMRSTLDKASDREAVLSRFVDELSEGDTRTLRRLLESGPD
ncbi:MAG TPA: BlaI/MecI/CopY family transcriptional regulator [Acidimicrobiales bacterium]|nr:BlaI/MecI/CopY family transcriptional regulator [Acidimicrobiales bacterium]